MRFCANIVRQPQLKPNDYVRVVSKGGKPVLARVIRLCQDSDRVVIKTQHQKEREVSRSILFPDVDCIDLLRYNYFFDEEVHNYVRSDFDSAGNVILPLEKREVQEVDCEEDRHQAMCGVCGRIRLV